MLEGVRARLREIKVTDKQARSSLHKWVKTGTVPSIHALARFAERENVSIVYVLTGAGCPQNLDILDFQNFRSRLSFLVRGVEKDICAAAHIELATLTSWTSPTQKTFPKIDGLLSIARTANGSVRWLLTGEGSERPFEGDSEIKASPLQAAREPLDGIPPDFEAAQNALSELEAILELCAETQDWHAVGLVRRDLDALLADIRRLYPELARRISSAKNGVA